MRRREFLKLGVGLAGGMGGTASLPVAAWAASGSLADRLAAFGRDLRGRLVTADDAAYAMLSQPWNAAFEGVRPLAVVRRGGRGRRRHRDRLRPRGGDPLRRPQRPPQLSPATPPRPASSSTSARSIAVRADPAGATVTVGAGQTNLPLYEALWPHRMVVPAGTCPTVGITGLALGGGLGRLSPLHGLTSDNLLGLRMVTAEGKVVVADARENADLYLGLPRRRWRQFRCRHRAHLPPRSRPTCPSPRSVQYTFPFDAALGGADAPGRSGSRRCPARATANSS